MTKLKVVYFYSSTAEHYDNQKQKEIMDTLKEGKKTLGFELNAFDVIKRPDLAEENKILETPVIIFETEQGKKRYAGLSLVEELEQIFEEFETELDSPILSDTGLGHSMRELEELLGEKETARATILQEFFRKGKEKANMLSINLYPQKQVNERLSQELVKLGCNNIKISSKGNISKISLNSSIPLGYGKSTEAICFAISGFIGGFLSIATEKELFTKEKNCIAQGKKECVFEVKTSQEKVSEKEISEMVKKAIKWWKKCEKWFKKKWFEMKINEIKKELKKLPENYLALFIIDSANYLDTNIAVVKEIVNKNNSGVYITLNRPYNSLTKVFEDKGIPTNRIFFIDGITKSVGKTEKAKNCLYVESPQNLTHLSIIISKATEALPTKEKFLFLDALTTLMIYNKAGTVNKFLHYLTGRMRILKLKGVLLSIQKDLDPKIEQQITQFVDKTIDLSKGG